MLTGADRKEDRRRCVAGRGSVEKFTEVVAGFLTKDVDVARKAVAELGGDLGVLDAAITARFRSCHGLVVHSGT